MKFITIGYGDESGYESTDSAVLEKAHAYDAQLIRNGAQTGRALEPVQVRNHDDAGTTTQKGSYMRADLPVAGFSIIEADSLEDAIKLASHVPCAVAHGVVEVWPLQDE